MWLTDWTSNNRKIWIHPACIEVMMRTDYAPDWPDKTIIRTKSGGHEEVKETPEEILDLIMRETK